jgi:hypothetical protein
MQNPQSKKSGGGPAKMARKSARVKVAGTIERDPFATIGAALKVWEVERRTIGENLVRFGIQTEAAQ